MTATTVRATARSMSKAPPPKPETGEAAILRALDAETRQLKDRAADAERVLAAVTPSDEPSLLDLSDELGCVHDLVDAAYFVANSLPPGLGKEPMSRLLNVITDKLADARNDLDRIREART